MMLSLTLRRGALLLCSIALSVRIHAQAPLRDDDIAAAIKSGQGGKFDGLIAHCFAAASFGASMTAGLDGKPQPVGVIQLLLTASTGRIARQAAEAKRLYRPFSSDALSPDLREWHVYVEALPNEPTRGASVQYAPTVQQIVLRSRATTLPVALPQDFQSEPVTWGNLAGGTISSNHAIARFDWKDVATIPRGDLEIVLVTDAGERTCRISEKDRLQVLSVVAAK